jgi:dynein heavy chain, axonemal
MEVTDLRECIVRGTISLYNAVVKGMLPTPSKPHYTFNLRDVGKVFQGMLMAEGRVLAEPEIVVRLWLHECSRVFQDRLVNDEDRAWLEIQLREELDAHFGASWEDIVDESQVDVSGKTRLMFCDFLVPGAEPRLYDEVADIAGLIPTVEEYLADYNSESKVGGWSVLGFGAMVL